jgi:hypothetical protein
LTKIAKYDIIYIEKEKEGNPMSIITRRYCIVRVKFPSGKFLAVEGIKDTYDEAFQFSQYLPCGQDESFVIWCVIDE